MCIILVAWQVDSHFPLVVAANRDEFFARLTRSAAFWPEIPHLLAGKDLLAGGTWLGITRSRQRGGADGSASKLLSFRFAALTNFRDPAREKPSALSRGNLALDFLRGDASPIDYLAQVAIQGDAYNGFNLLVCDGETLACYNNTQRRSERLAPGIHGLSNHMLNTPWPKVNSAMIALDASLSHLPATEPLFRFLRDDTIAADETLPNTGVPLETERFLSSVFVRGPEALGYGTRSSTVLVLSTDGGVTFDEQEWDATARSSHRQRFRFTLE